LKKSNARVKLRKSHPHILRPLIKYDSIRKLIHLCKTHEI